MDPDYLAAASYLAEVGFTNKTEIARVLDVAMNPNSLFVQASVNANARPLTVETDMRPVVEFLQAQGVKAGDIVKVSSAQGGCQQALADTRSTAVWLSASTGWHARWSCSPRQIVCTSDNAGGF